MDGQTDMHVYILVILIIMHLFFYFTAQLEPWGNYTSEIWHRQQFSRSTDTQIAPFQLQV